MERKDWQRITAGMVDGGAAQRTTAGVIGRTTQRTNAGVVGGRTAQRTTVGPIYDNCLVRWCGVCSQD